MEILKLRLHNFKTFTDFELDFETLNPGLYPILGDVGAGKTTISEAILFGLYGNSSLLECNVGDLVKWGNQTGTVELYINSNSNFIYIKRVLAVSKRADLRNVMVWVNNTRLTGPNMNSIQETLETEYYDTPKLAVTALSIISFNNFIPVSCVRQSAIKQIISGLFNINILDSWIKNIKKTKRERIDNINTLKLEVENLTGQAIVYNKYLNCTKTPFDDLIKTQESQIKRMQVLRDKLDGAIQYFDGLLSPINSEYHRIKEIGKLKKFIQNPDSSNIHRCPLCHNMVNSAQLQVIKNTEKSDLEHIIDIKSKIDEIKNKKKEAIEKLNTELNIVHEQNKKTEAEIFSYEKSPVNGGDIIRLENAIKERSDSIAEQNKEIDILNSIIEYLDFEIRQKYIETLLPAINKNILKYATALGAPWNIRLNQNFNFDIIIDDEIRQPAVLSTGQRKITDIIIILALLNTIIKISNINILFFDEAFNNLSENIKSRVFKLLEEIAEKEGKKIFITDHSNSLLNTKFAKNAITL